MIEQCLCDIKGQAVDPSKKYFTSERKSGQSWTPAFVEYIIEEKCTGCGLCVRVCVGNCYELIEVNGKKKAKVVNGQNCLGDCHCHKLCKPHCIVCKPREMK